MKKWIKKYNRKFAQLADESVFEEKLTPSKANIILARVANRKINNGHHIRYHNEFYLPMKNSEELYFTSGSEVLVIEAFNGEIYVNIADEIYHTRRLESHELHSNTFDEVVEKKKKDARISHLNLIHGNWHLSDGISISRIKSSKTTIEYLHKELHPYYTNNAFVCANFL